MQPLKQNEIDVLKQMFPNLKDDKINEYQRLLSRRFEIDQDDIEKNKEIESQIKNLINNWDKNETT